MSAVVIWVVVILVELVWLAVLAVGAIWLIRVRRRATHPASRIVCAAGVIVLGAAAVASIPGSLGYLGSDDDEGEPSRSEVQAECEETTTPTASTAATATAACDCLLDTAEEFGFAYDDIPEPQQNEPFRRAVETCLIDEGVVR